MKRILLFGLTTFFLMTTLETANAAFFQKKSANKKHHSVHLRKVKKSKYSGLVNLNTANIKQLSSLKGIGTKKAEAILAYRKKSGNFHSLNDLKGVRGIGNKFIQRLSKNNKGRVIVKG